MLRGLSWHRSYTSHVYFNPGVLWELARGRPAAVVIDGFSPTMALAGLWALCNRIPLGISTDGSRSTDPGRTSRVHRALRRAFVPRAQFGIGASESSRELLASYGLSRERCAVVPIVSAWDPPQQRNPFDKRPFDLLFCGALNEDIKGALFFAETVERLQAGRREPLAVRVAGDGPDRSEMLTRLERAGARVRFDGFLDQDQLVEAYGSAKLLAFPSRGDAWGLVANEAVQCGTPVIGSPHAVSSLELVDRFGAGCLVPLDSAAWVEAISDVLAKRTRWESMHENCRRAVESFSVATSVARMKSALTPFLG
jgi:glycosyltransferase involved in cell wall biosynthesis